MTSGLFSKLRGLFREKEQVSANTIEEKPEKTSPPPARKPGPRKADKEGKETDDSPLTVKERVAEKSHEVRGMFQRVIQPEERTLKNYVNIGFWRKKKAEYDHIREKEKQDLNVFSVLEEGALPTIEYYILTVLSCIIATAGLLQGSTAVIIGAMIVAPLMTPILAMSLGVIWGDANLIKTSGQSIIKGVFVSVAISAIIAYIIPISQYTNEILARTKPSIFDIIVALASGVVGAYGNANKRISSTLVGIAIAVALMPPLCTIGIGLGTFNREIATGAALLFLINLVSISLAGAVVFWAMKIHPILADTEAVKKRALVQIEIATIILILISIPVGFYMYEGYNLARTQEYVHTVISSEIPGSEILSMTSQKTEGGYHIKLAVLGDSIPPPGKMNEIRKQIRDHCDCVRETTLRFITSSTESHGVKVPDK